MVSYNQNTQTSPLPYRGSYPRHRMAASLFNPYPLPLFKQSTLFRPSITVFTHSSVSVEYPYRHRLSQINTPFFLRCVFTSLRKSYRSRDYRLPHSFRCCSPTQPVTGSVSAEDEAARAALFPHDGKAAAHPLPSNPHCLSAPTQPSLCLAPDDSTAHCFRVFPVLRNPFCASSALGNFYRLVRFRRRSLPPCIFRANLKPVYVT